MQNVDGNYGNERTAKAVLIWLRKPRSARHQCALRQFAGYKLLVIDELGYVPLSQTGAELLFEVFRNRHS